MKVSVPEPAVITALLVALPVMLILPEPWVTFAELVQVPVTAITGLFVLRSIAPPLVIQFPLTVSAPPSTVLAAAPDKVRLS